MWTAGISELKGRQRLNIWYSKTIFGPGMVFKTFGIDSTGELTNRPYIPAFIVSSCPEDIRDLERKWVQDAGETGLEEQLKHFLADKQQLARVSNNFAGYEDGLAQVRKSLVMGKLITLSWRLRQLWSLLNVMCHPLRTRSWPSS